jgi:hypothetical protein
MGALAKEHTALGAPAAKICGPLLRVQQGARRIWAFVALGDKKKKKKPLS